MREAVNVAQQRRGCKAFNFAHGTLKREKGLYLVVTQFPITALYVQSGLLPTAVRPGASTTTPTGWRLDVSVLSRAMSTVKVAPGFSGMV